MKYVLGLDIGISSIGWAVVNTSSEARIEDAGVRLFDSGEFNGGKDRTSQERRGFRSVRRLVRRRSHRKIRLKKCLELIGLISVNEVEQYFETNNPEVLKLRVMGLSEKLAPYEIAACLINICNHRGYRDFYEIDLETADKKEKEEYLKENEGIAIVQSIMERGNYRTVAEMYLRAPEFKNTNGGDFPFIRNKKNRESTYPISRALVEKEADMILCRQKEYYPQLTEENIEKIKYIIFSQRDFEDGPGNPEDPNRRYTGFLDNLGKCMYYKDEERGFRFTVLADVYALVNVLSQYRYFDAVTGEINLPEEAAKAMVQFALQKGTISEKELKAILKEFNTVIDTKISEKKEPISNCMKYTKAIKPILENAGFDWNELITESIYDYDKLSFLNQIGIVLSKFHTPHRRISELVKIDKISEELARIISSKKLSGTSKVSMHYMADAIEAFLNGEAYGNFQAEMLKKREESEKNSENAQMYLPAFGENEEFSKNPVVFRSINETRKVLNAIIRTYGSPSAINLEIASELNRSYEERKEIEKKQGEREKLNNKYKEAISELIKVPLDEVTAGMLERYKLGELQGWRCLYSQKEIDKENCIRGSKNYEIDHIIPFSLILDNTLENKALVMMSENQLKAQRTPLMYLSDEKKISYLSKINTLFKDKKISKKKYEYLLIDNLSSEKALEKLKEWKIRNMNDTRYITKFLVNYLSNNLQFDTNKPQPVYGVKGAITSRFRRMWLNESTWGTYDKDEMRKKTQLHHAVDAVVIANCLPAYVEIASDNMKLFNMFKQAGKWENEEYRDYLEKCKRKMKKIYGFDEDYTEKLLRHKGKVPSLIKDLRSEVDIRFNDNNSELFNSQVLCFYGENDFSQSLTMPLVSYKQDKKAVGKITDSNAIRVVEIDGINHKIARKNILELSKKDAQRLYTNDMDLKNSIEILLSKADDKMTVSDILKLSNIQEFTTQKGRRVNKVSVFENAPSTTIAKEISEDNKTYLDAGSYYCVEIYEDNLGKTRTRGIMYADLLKKDKKLWLKCDYPEDYKKHIMYLFKNDYIEIWNRNGEFKFEGYYKSVSAIKINRFFGVPNNQVQTQKSYISIASTDKVKKYHIDILGKKGGEIKCGAPLLLITEKK